MLHVLADPAPTADALPAAVSTFTTLSAQSLLPLFLILLLLLLPLLQLSITPTAPPVSAISVAAYISSVVACSSVHCPDRPTALILTDAVSPILLPCACSYCFCCGHCLTTVLKVLHTGDSLTRSGL